jgi:hypothetical protein
VLDVPTSTPRLASEREQEVKRARDGKDEGLRRDQPTSYSPPALVYQPESGVTSKVKLEENKSVLC